MGENSLYKAPVIPLNMWLSHPLLEGDSAFHFLSTIKPDFR